MTVKKFRGTPFHVWGQATDMDWFMKYFGIGPQIVERGEGPYLYSSHGVRYINGLSSMWNIAAGLGREELVEAAVAQMRELAFSPNWSMAHPRAIELAAKLVEITGGRYQHVLYGCNGSDAVEAALKMARQYHRQSPNPADHGRFKIIAQRGSYHGFSYGCLSAPGEEANQQSFGPLLDGFIQIDPPYCYRCPFGKTAYPECGLACAQALEDRITAEGPQTVAALILEPVMGNMGALAGPDEYYQKAGEICQRHGLLLIADEVTTGFGRTGRMFATQDWDPQPDILLLAKAITNGYFPLSVTLATQAVFERFSGPGRLFSHGVTHAGHPVGCAIALAAINIHLTEDLAGNSARVGAHLKAGLEALMPSRPQIGEVRGRGLMVGVELVTDRQSRAPLSEKAAADVALDLDLGGLLVARHSNIINLMPPLIIDEPLADQMVAMVDRALDTRFSTQVGKKAHMLKEFVNSKIRP